MLLYINTADQSRVHIALVGSNKIDGKKFLTSRNLSERLMPAILDLLKKSGTSFLKLKKIVVVRGPGSFSSVRAGVATANALSYALNLPIGGISLTEAPVNLKEPASLPFIKRGTLPIYGSPPHITKPKNLSASFVPDGTPTGRQFKKFLSAEVLTKAERRADKKLDKRQARSI